MATDRIIHKVTGIKGTIYGLLDVDTFFIRFDDTEETVLVSRNEVKPLNDREFLPNK